ncbi:MAG: NAD(+)/NADH kinase [Candidatus Marsarchaeota archaeon]|nr:NAD(+)/NADH kinase [Candidatus Marsarchaeota archaeon]
MAVFAVVSNLSKEASHAASEFCAELSKRGLSYVSGIPLTSLGDHELTSCDTVFTFGGDGTILRAAARFSQASPLIVGVNYGRLGFLAEVERGSAINALEAILKGEERFYVVQRLVGLAAAEGAGGRSVASPPCTNEIMVSPTSPSRLLTLEVDVQDTLSYRGRLDALIVSTALGSTAYSLSAGGPVVDPSSRAVLLTPVAPINMALRPMVIDNSKTVTVTNRGSADALLFSDGVQWGKLSPGDAVEISKHTHPLRLYRTENNILEKLFRRRLT